MTMIIPVYHQLLFTTFLLIAILAKPLHIHDIVSVNFNYFSCMQQTKKEVAKIWTSFAEYLGIANYNSDHDSAL